MENERMEKKVMKQLKDGELAFFGSSGYFVRVFLTTSFASLNSLSACPH